MSQLSILLENYRKKGYIYCRNGHELTIKNVYKSQDKYLKCKICVAEQQKISRRNIVKISRTDQIANFIKFYNPTKEEICQEFNLKPLSLVNHFADIKKKYPMKREIRYRIE